MVSLTEEQFNRLLAAAKGVEPRWNEGGGGRLDSKHFKRLETFDGAENTWKEWYFNFSVIVKTCSTKVGDMLKDVENASSEITVLAVKQRASERAWTEDDYEKYSAEMFSVLCQLTKGEANVTVRTATDQCGFVAWHLLYTRHNPRTPARFLMALQEAVRPPQVKDVRVLGKAVEEWEVKCAALTQDHREGLTEKVRVAVLINMIPRDLQDMVYQGCTAGKELNYKEIRDKIMAVVSNRVQISLPTPMEIGEVGGGEAEGGWDGEDWSIEAIGGGTCYRCGGVGHFSRECPTAKGKGVESKGKGKNNFWEQVKGKSDHQKGNFWDKGKGKKGGGKGDPGKGMKCFNCGGLGHRKAECPSRSYATQAVETGEEDEHERDIGGVWMIGCVEKSTETAVKNSFQALTVDEESRPEERFIGAIDKSSWELCGQGEITIDSAAEESVCPRRWREDFPVVPTAKKMNFLNASGGRMEHYGEKQVKFVTKESEKRGSVMGLDFQASDVRKPLAAVWRIAEKGNVVRFGPLEEDNYIQNVETGEKQMMRKKGRSYVLDVEFVQSVFQRRA